MSNYNDNDDEVHDMFANRPSLDSFPNYLNNEIQAEAFYVQEQEHGRIRTEQRLNDMSRQISELSILVRTVIQRETPPPREENVLSATTTNTESRSDSKSNRTFWNRTKMAIQHQDNLFEHWIVNQWNKLLDQPIRPNDLWIWIIQKKKIQLLLKN